MLFRISSFLIYLSKVISSRSSKNEFINSFQTQVLKPKPNLDKILALRSFYASNDTKIQIEDYGAGSKTLKNNNFITTKSLFQKVGISHKYGRLLFNLIDFLKVENTLELGTSLGLSASYMSNARVTTLEGNKDLAEKTTKNLKDFGFSKIEVVQAKFDDVLVDLLNEKKFDLIFIDGNHTEEATLRYFKTCLQNQRQKFVIIFDDIYWSNGMKNAWKTIKKSKDVKLSIDLFKFGIVFINNELTDKEDITLWY